MSVSRLAACLLIASLLVSPVLAGEADADSTIESKTNLGNMADVVERGDALLAKREFAKAYEQYMVAFLARPTNVRINFSLGRAAFEMGDFESAVMAFERILSMDPKLSRVKLELARAYAHMGTKELATRHFEEVLKGNPPESVRENIKQYMTQMEKGFDANGRPKGAGAPKPGHSFSGSISLGLQRDTNIRVSPAATTVTTIIGDVTLDADSGKATDWIYNNTFVLNHKYKMGNSPWAWKTSLVNYNAFYDTTDALDLNLFGLMSGPVLEFENLLMEMSFHSNYLEQNHKSYVRTGGLSGQATVVMNENLLIYFGGKTERKKYYQITSKDATTTSVHGGPVWLWGKDNLHRLTGKLMMETEDAKDNVNSYTRFVMNTRYDRKLPLDFNVYAAYQYQNVTYNDEQALFSRARKDNIHDFTIGAGKQFWVSEDKKSSLSADLNHVFSKSWSNTELYLYDRHVTSFTLTYRF